MSSPTSEIDKALASMHQLARPESGKRQAEVGRRKAKVGSREVNGSVSSARRLPGSDKRRNGLSRLGWGAGMLAVGLLLPFVLLLRTSMYGYQDQLWNPWLALGAGVLAATTGTLFYGFIGTRLLGFRPRFGRGTVKLLAALLAIYAGYATLYIAAANVKTPAVRAAYTELHPMLRLAVGTLVLTDSDMVVTDGPRQPDDYRAMGLPVNRGSLHYAQEDGYVHAVDLRTNGRAEWKNRLMALYFRALGFDTLRHVGTADHLHVSLGVR